MATTDDPVIYESGVKNFCLGCGAFSTASRPSLVYCEAYHRRSRHAYARADLRNRFEITFFAPAPGVSTRNRNPHLHATCQVCGFEYLIVSTLLQQPGESRRYREVLITAQIADDPIPPTPMDDTRPVRAISLDTSDDDHDD